MSGSAASFFLAALRSSALSAPRSVGVFLRVVGPRRIRIHLPSERRCFEELEHETFEVFNRHRFANLEEVLRAAIVWSLALPADTSPVPACRAAGSPCAMPESFLSRAAKANGRQCKHPDAVAYGGAGNAKSFRELGLAEFRIHFENSRIRPRLFDRGERLSRVGGDLGDGRSVPSSRSDRSCTRSFNPAAPA